MDANALHSHAKGKKHCDIAKNCLAGLHCSFFWKEETPAVNTAKKTVKKYVRTAKVNYDLAPCIKEQLEK